MTMDKHKAMIAQAVIAEGLRTDVDTIVWREDEIDGLYAALGDYRALEDSPSGMFSEGEEGELRAQVVGSAQHGNERVMFGFIVEGTDSPDEVDPMILEAA